MLNYTYKLMASVTVVRELYDSNNNLYDVLEKFINELIFRENLYSFTAHDITESLNKQYSFKLNESVIKTCLRRMKFPKKNGTYSCDDLIKRGNQRVETFIDESEQNNDKLFGRLLIFIEQKQENGFLDDRTKNIIKSSFCDFLLQDGDGTEDSLSQLFYEFILSIENDAEMMKILKAIKEGTLLYEGLRYCSISEIGAWNTNLNIILDTEILFAVGGYNSMMYQELYKELDKYISEINRGNKKTRINLYYFAETKKELDSYFDSAERIVKQLDFLDPTKEAMQQIVNNCKTPSDVQMKRTAFWGKLSDKNIKQLDYDFYDVDNERNSKFNLEDEEVIYKYSEAWRESQDNIHRSLKVLSHINILRKGKSDVGFEQCEYIFLTATGRTLRLAAMPELTKEGNIRFATNLDFLINKLWFKLNKGFGASQTPRTLDMVMRSRHILASILKSKAADNFEELKKRYVNGEISKEEFICINNDLRAKLKDNNEVDVDTIGDEIESLEQWDFDCVLEEQKRRETQLKEVQKENLQLKECIENYKQTQTENKEEISQLKVTLFETQKKYEKIMHDATEQIQHIQNETEKYNKENKILQDKYSQIIYKGKLNRYRIFCTVVILMLGIGIFLFIYGEVHECALAKYISALLEVVGVISFIINSLIKKKPKKDDYK